MSTGQSMSWGPRMNRAGWTLTGLVLVVAGLTGMAPAPAAPWNSGAIARLGPITVSATALTPGPSGSLTASVRVSTAGPRPDQLDAAIAAGGTAVAVYHELVGVAQLADLTDCGGDVTPAGVVARWMHYGPLQVPGRAGGQSQQADATLTVQPAAPVRAGGTLPVTLYFAQAGPVVLRLPVGS